MPWGARLFPAVSDPLLVAALMGAAATSAATIEEFERVLASQDSATAALGQWCERHGIAQAASIRASVVGRSTEAAAETRTMLGLKDQEPVGYRHVRLACGDTILSEAYNWFAPSRLTPDMNRALAESDTPFGKVAAPLGFRRVRLLEERGRADFCPPDTILIHRALLRLPDGQPLAYVVECYSAANLAVAR